ncbi:hypothetical protein [Hymenobacter norwichensis]|uniref:hypothetical protein n=1 Tax=Hymenobacter norwichensis TaxID=223903 RepID=UPI0003B309AA|nr:hypothetical protein [Hymenobacter norwichensis]
MSDQETIQELRTQLSALSAKNSPWVHVKDVATILTPIILLVGGFFVQRSMAADSAALTTSLNHQKENLDIELEKIRDSRQESAQKIEQSKLLTTLMQSMLSQKPSERQLAINIALHACGESGRQVVEAISLDDKYAYNQLTVKRKGLVAQLVAPDARKRWEAAHELGTTWSSDPELLNDLLLFARDNTRTPLALYNTLVVFADLPATSYIGKESLARELLALVKATGPRGAKTDVLVETIQAKIASSAAR